MSLVLCALSVPVLTLPCWFAPGAPPSRKIFYMTRFYSRSLADMLVSAVGVCAPTPTEKITAKPLVRARGTWVPHRTKDHARFGPPERETDTITKRWALTSAEQREPPVNTGPAEFRHEGDLNRVQRMKRAAMEE